MGTLQTFVEAVNHVRKVTDRPSSIASGVASNLKMLLDKPSFLEERFREPGENEPRSHIIYVSPDKAFSIVSFVWRPGQVTSVHDHVCWCVVGVLQGIEEETRYILKQDKQGNKWLEAVTNNTVRPGHTCALVPPDEDIHQVKNAGGDVAISIHVYGANIEERGTSINHRFDSYPILPTGRPGEYVSWRKSHPG